MTAADRIRKMTETAESMQRAIDAHAADPSASTFAAMCNEEDLYDDTFPPPTVLALLRVAATAERHVGACGYTGTCSGERPDITAVGLTRALNAFAATGDGQGGGEEG